MTQPNMLWICTDQQRWDTLSFLGHAGARTPNIDRLAAEGTAFDRAYCQSPICTPSRASFLSGKYPIATGVQRNGNVAFPDDIVLVPRLFRDAGYRTGLIGKLHLSRAQGVVEKRPADDGYDEFYWSHHPDPDWGPEGARLPGLARGARASTRRRSTTRCARIGAGVKAEDHQTTWAGDRAKRFMRAACRAAVVPVDQPLRSASAVRSAGGLSRASSTGRRCPGRSSRHRISRIRQRLFEVDQQARVAVDPRRGDPNSPLYEPPGRGRRARTTTRRRRPTTASWCGRPITR